MMSKRMMVVLFVVVVGMLVLGTSLLSAQADCPDPSNCPVGQQNGPNGIGRFGMRQNDDTSPGRSGNGNQFGNAGGQQGGRFGSGNQFGNAGGQMGNGRFGAGNRFGGPAGQPNGGIAGGAQACYGTFGCLPEAVPGELAPELVEAMTAGLMDEVNAYAVYDGIIAQLGELRPFTNIQNAEAQHIAAWEFLFDRYGVALPAESATVEVPAFTTSVEACQFAYDAEVGNAGLYDTLLATFAGYPDITQVVTSLRDASAQNHTVALEHCLSR